MRIFPLFFFIGLIFSCHQPQESSQTYDVVVIGGGASGTMAGIQAARLGSNTIIIEESPWLGGMLTSAGVSAIDGNYKLHSGLWQEFRENLNNHYGGEDSLKTGWVSNVLFEPDVGANILRKMAKAETNLVVWIESSISSIEFINDHWRIEVYQNGENTSLKAKVVVDGTELGDVSKMVGIPYDIGMDSRIETNEDIAPQKSNNIIQDLTYVAILKDYGDNPHLIEKPDNYDPNLFYCTCAGKCAQDTISRKLWDCEQMMKYGKLPNNKYMINWPIYGNDFYLNVIDLDRSARNEAFEKAKWHTMCYIYYLQNELGFEHLGIADDVFATDDGFPFFPYHRESRRIKGIVRFDINDLARPFDQQDALYRTAIAVGDYPVDHHHDAYPENEKLPDLHFYPVPSYGLPLGTLIPENVNNFIVAEKSISVTNLVNGTSRLQPVCLLIGQAAGVLAHLSAKNGVSPKDVGVRDVQGHLLQEGAYIMPYSDITPDDLAFNSVQRIGATGILKGEGKNVGWENHTLFYPDSLVTYKELKEGLAEFEEAYDFELNKGKISVIQAIEYLAKLNANLNQSDKINKLDVQHIWSEYQLGDFEESQAITRKQLAVLLDKMVNPFETKQLDHFGMYLD